MLKQHSQTKTQVLKHIILQSLRLQPERVPKRAQTSPQQFEFVTPVEPVPSGQQRLAVFQLRFPFLSESSAEAAWHGHADESDQPSTEAKARCLCWISHHSHRNAVIGSTRAALLAGR